MARRLLTLFVALFVVLAPAAAMAEGKIAVIDLRRAVVDTEDGLRVQAQLKELFDSRQTALEKKEKDFAEAKNKFEKEAKGGKLPQDKLQKKYETLAKQKLELQQVVMDYRREMQQRESQLMYPIVQRLLGLVRQLASQAGYSMVVNREAVPYYRSDLDVTDRVIQMYNSSIGPNKGGDKKAPAKAPAKKPAPKR